MAIYFGVGNDIVALEFPGARRDRDDIGVDTAAGALGGACETRRTGFSIQVY